MLKHKTRLSEIFSQSLVVMIFLLSSSLDLAAHRFNHPTAVLAPTVDFAQIYSGFSRRILSEHSKIRGTGVRKTGFSMNSLFSRVTIVITTDQRF
jgi:hypothetical protein